MKISRRAQRMKRHYNRMHKAGGLNLVSLMDIFTILVFFLMVNSSDVKVLQQDKTIELPKSLAQQDPKDTLVLTVSDYNLLVQGRLVANLEEELDSEVIAGLKTELEYQAKRSQEIKPIDPETFDGFPITIMADKEIPYKYLKKVMATCAAAKFTKISLAVSKQARPSEGA